MKKQILTTLVAGILTCIFELPMFAQEIKMVEIPGKKIKMSKTEITQKQYEEVMGENPSYFQQSNTSLEDGEKQQLKDSSGHPVENISWYDAIVFCNKLSKKKGLKPVYSVNGTTDVSKWNYTPHQDEEIKGAITQDTTANGFRLATLDEWLYAAKADQSYPYSGSNDINEVGWHRDNSKFITHPVAQKKANGYSLYDMSGNVCEWVWDSADKDEHYICGGGFGDFDDRCEIDSFDSNSTKNKFFGLGIRIVQSDK